jgi:hypothetical protein
VARRGAEAKFQNIVLARVTISSKPAHAEWQNQTEGTKAGGAVWSQTVGAMNR